MPRIPPTFEQSFASHEKSIFLRDTKLDPRNIFRSSNKKYWFVCAVCGHEFEIMINNATKRKSQWCPYCSKPSQKLCANKYCNHCFDRSFASHKRSKYLKHAKNDPLVIFKSSGKKFWFVCDVCNHDFEATINSITRKIKPSWCPYCTSQKLCEVECDLCVKNSFLSHENSIFLKYKKDDAQYIFKSGKTKFWFICNTCNHDFEASINNVAKGKWCPYCSAPPKKLCDDLDCEHCFNKSFASHERSEFLKYKKDNPHNIFKGSHKKRWFVCEDGHSFEAAINSVTNKDSPSWCPKCKNKTEKKMLKWLTDTYDVQITFQAKFEWSKNVETGKYLPFDFCIKSAELVIEVDGPQHFEQIANWGCHKKTQKRDIYKMKQAAANGFSVIRVLQDDVLHDKNKWEKKLRKIIRHYKKPKIFCVGDRYDCHKITV